MAQMTIQEAICSDIHFEVHAYKEVVYENIYSHIDFKIYEYQESLKYDLPLLEFETFDLEKWIEVLRNELKFRK